MAHTNQKRKRGKRSDPRLRFGLASLPPAAVYPRLSVTPAGSSRLIRNMLNESGSNRRWLQIDRCRVKMNRDGARATN